MRRSDREPQPPLGKRGRRLRKARRRACPCRSECRLQRGFPRKVRGRGTEAMFARSRCARFLKSFRLKGPRQAREYHSLRELWRSPQRRERCRDLLHGFLNRNRFKDKTMQHFKVLQRPLRVLSDARRCSVLCVISAVMPTRRHYKIRRLRQLVSMRISGNIRARDFL